MNFKTIFIASKRINYFEITLLSIKDQIHECELYIDGDETDLGIIQNINTFKKYFPSSTINKLNYKSPDLTISKIFIDNFNKNIENIFLVEDDLYFSHNYIEQSTRLYDFIKNDDRIVTFSCFSRETLGWSYDEIVKNKNCLVPQHNHIGTFIKFNLFEKLYKNYIEEYHNLLVRDRSTRLLKNYCRQDLQIYSNSYPIDSFYSLLIRRDGRYRVSTIYNKLINRGEIGTNCNPKVYLEEGWYKCNYIEDFINEFTFEPDNPNWPTRYYFKVLRNLYIGKDWIEKFVGDHENGTEHGKLEKIQRLKLEYKDSFNV